MLARFGSLLILLFMTPLVMMAPALSQTAPDQGEELLRLPGSGEFKPDLPKTEGLGRLVPGGGLLMSFDTDEDSMITPEEIALGITAAFAKADANEDGRITPLEQVRWSETLPTRDTSLANPARFDPNLDRAVRIEEFQEVITLFAAIYADETTGNITLDALKAKDRGDKRRDEEQRTSAEDRPQSTQQPPGRSPR